MAYQNVLNEPHIKYNPVSKLYIDTRTVKGKSQYEGGITSLTKAKQIRDKFVKALPAETTAQTNIRTKTFSGNIDPKELYTQEKSMAEHVAYIESIKQKIQLFN